MNPFSFIISMFKGGNVWQTVSKVLDIAAGYVAAIDTDRKGTDDLVADIMASSADGLAAYGRKDYNGALRVIDAIIAGLQRMKTQLITERAAK